MSHDYKLSSAELANILTMDYFNDSLNLSVEDQITEIAHLVDENGTTEVDINLTQATMKEAFQDYILDKYQHFSKKTQEIMNLRFGLKNEEPRTIEEIAQILNLSTEEVKQIEHKALQRLFRHRLTN